MLCAFGTSASTVQAAVAYQQFTEAKTSPESTSITISTPAGASAGDLLIVAVATDGNNSTSLIPPAGEGWAQIALDQESGVVTLGVWWKITEVSESGTHQFTWSSSQEAYAWMMRFTGHDAIAPIDATATNGGTSSSPTSPAVTATIANTMILRLGGFDVGDITVDSPGLASHTAITMDESSTGAGACSGGAGYVAQAAVGSSGTSTFSLTASQEYRTVTVAIAQSPTTDLANGLAAFWKFNEGSGTNATDSSSNTNDGTLFNTPTWTNGKFGGALSFNEVDEYVRANDFSYGPEFTVSFWMNVDDNSGTAFQYLFSHGTVATQNSLNVMLVEDSSTIRTSLNDTDDTDTPLDVTASIDGTGWHLYTIVISTPNGTTIYLDGGQQLYDSSRGGDSFDPTTNIFLATREDLDASRFYGGKLDDVRIYNRALSTGEIVRLANSAGLVGHWKLDDGSGTTAIDSAGGNDGTLTNGPTWVTAGKLCGALSFDGTNDYVDLVASSTLISGDASFSLSAWFQTSVLYDSGANPDFLGGRVVTIYQSNVGSQSSKAAIGLYGDNTDTVMFMYGNPGVSGIIKTNTSFNDGKWHHLAGTYDAVTNDSTLYYDGVDVASADAGTIVSAGTEVARIGTGTTTNLGLVNGLIDDVRIFTRALAPWEIKNLAATYQVIDLGSATGDRSLASKLNASEQVAGFDSDPVSGDSTAWFQQYCNFSTIATLAGGSENEALGINDAGTVVGWSGATGSIRKAISWTSGGGTVDLGLMFGRTDSEAIDVNASNEVAGTAFNFGVPPKKRLAFLYLPVAKYGLSMGINNLGTLGGGQSVAQDVNDSGEVVGGAQDATPTMKPFLWLPSAAYGLGAGMNSVGTLGGNSNEIIHRGQAINATGKVVGRSYTAGGEGHAFHWESGTMTDMGTLTGGTSSWAFDINDSGTAVGTSNVSGGAFHAFVWDGTTMTDLNSRIDSNSGWTLTRATGINNDGEITGWGTNGAGNVRAFMLVQTCAASTATSGSIAATVLAEVSGITDDNGDFAELAVDHEGIVLAEVRVEQALPGESIRFSVTASSTARDAPGPGIGSLAGFGNNVALDRTLIVEGSQTDGDNIVSVSMVFSMDELATTGVEPQDLQIHLLDENTGVWSPLGESLGLTTPTGVVGESGYEFIDEDSVEFWSVATSTGIFGVGAAKQPEMLPDMQPYTQADTEVDMLMPATEETSRVDPTMLPNLCGVAMIQSVLMCSLLLLAGRRRSHRREPNITR